MREAVFLDRDGTINFDPGYIGDPTLLRLLPGALEGLQRLYQNGFLLIVVSNQSGVGRGFFTEDDLVRVHQRLDELLSEGGVFIHSYELCLHHPADQCDCRKPSPRLVLDAAKKFDLDLSKSYFIGDKESDVECGFNAGVKESFWIQESATSLPEKYSAWKVRVARNLNEASQLILREIAKNSREVKT